MLIDPDDEAVVVRLVGRPYVVEVLEALINRPLTQRQLRRVLRVRRPRLTVALRALAAYGAIRRRDSDPQGSWDGRDPASARYELTATGRWMVGQLERADVWDALYQGDHEEP